jgi:hypothetical protein
MSVLRHCRLPASFLREFGRSVARKDASVPTGTPASEFVALGRLRPDSVQRHQLSLLRGVLLRPVAYACRNSPRNTLQRVLAILRRTARRKTFARISERFAGQGRRHLGGPDGGMPPVPEQSVRVGRLAARKFK